MYKKTHDDLAEGLAVRVGGKKPAKRVMVALIIAGFAVLAVGVVVGLNMWQSRNAGVPKAVPESTVRQISDAQDQLFVGDYDKAHETINKALDNPDLSEDEQHGLYMQQAATYESQQNYPAAMESYRMAESLQDTAGVVQAIAALAVLMDDKELAIAYYKKALGLVPQDGPTADATRQYFENWITYLEGGQPNE